jgi:dimethylaniline monooxygenase (N-oxide forming)
MRIAIIGAGVSGLVAAKVLRRTGHEVIVFEKSADLGGVWNSARRYPDVSTQDDRITYSFSDAPMPADYPDHPSGPMVQRYLERYAEQHGLLPVIRFSNEVLSADLLPGDTGWSLSVRDGAGTAVLEFDSLVAANGTYSSPHVPPFAGRAGFEAAGGRIAEPSTIGDGALLRDRDVVVLGWGKTACDVAVAATRAARSVTLVARDLHWKYPKRIGDRLTFRHLLLTRGGEHLLGGPYRSAAGRAARLLTRVPRKVITTRLARAVGAQLDLDALGLLPSSGFADSNSLVTDGFYEAVRAGRLRVVRDSGVTDVAAEDGRPGVRLRDGAFLGADVLVPATGYEQEVDFLAERVRARLLEPDGELLLYRKVLPVSVPRLAFIGWSQSYRSPLLAEVQSFWLAGLLLGVVRVPDAARRRAEAHTYHLTHARAALAGAPQLPSGSFGELDMLLEDIGAPLPARVRARQLIRPIDPADYAYVEQRLIRAVPTGPPAPERQPAPLG